VLSNNTAGQDSLTFDGAFFGTNSSAVIVRYGPASTAAVGAAGGAGAAGSGWRDCSPITALADTSVTCRAAPGVGAANVFVVTVLGVPSLPGVDRYTTAAPTLRNGTLRFAIDTSYVGPASRTVQITSNTTQGDVVVMDGTNFGPDPSLISVTFGPPADPSTYTCFVVAGLTTNTSITCRTSPGEGFGHVFRVCTGLGTGPGVNTQCAIGGDAYNYPIAPVIASVSGCPVSDATTTSQCPTDGMRSDGVTPVRLTITGNNFVTDGSASVTIGGRPCQSVVSLSPTQMSCALPVGAGALQLVVIDQSSRLSAPVPAVSYAIPRLLRVSGCTDQPDNSTALCPRTGGTVVTLTGYPVPHFVLCSLCSSLFFVSPEPTLVRATLWC
jgi:hypothetical protein